MSEPQVLTDEKLGSIVAAAVSKGMTEDIATAVNTAVQSEVKRLGLDKVDLKHGVFSQEDANALPGLNEEQKAARKQSVTAKFLKAAMKRDFNSLSMIKGMSENVDSEGGFLVPEETATSVDRIVENVGLIPKLARRIPMMRETMNIPVLGNAASVTWDGEGNAGSDGSPTFGNVKLSAKKLTGLAPLTNELLEDANQDVASLVEELFGEAIATEIDRQGLVGTGSPFTGILSHSQVSVTTMGSTKTAFTDVTLGNLRDMISQIKMSRLPGSVFVMSPSMFGVVQKIQENNQSIVTFQNPIVPNTINGGVLVPAGYIWGYPVYVSEVMPATTATAVSTKFIIFGNFNCFYWGDRKNMSLSISDVATVGSVNAYASNQSVIRVIQRTGLAVGLPTGFSVLKTAAS
jgi:HK97 family phage major capsid protein